MLLALDSSTLTLSLALVERGDPVRVIEEVRYGPPQKVSELLPGVVGDLLAKHGVKLAELEGIVVGVGPGSFTGLRLGLASAKALAYAAQLRLAGTSSLAAVALEGPEGAPLFPLAVARQQELYVGHYVREGTAVRATSPEDAHAPAEIARLILQTEGAFAMGPAIPEYRAQLESLGVPPERLLDVGVVPSAGAVAQLTPLPDAYDAQALFALEPHYVRPSEAERNPKFKAPPGWEPKARLKED